MPTQYAAILRQLAQQINGLMAGYLRMLDDEFLFAAGTQVPKVATIFEINDRKVLPFGVNTVTLPELLALIAYRYGFTSIRHMGQGGYAIVIGHDPDHAFPQAEAPTDPELRRVIRFVPDHHVQNILARPDQRRPFDVLLDEHNEPIRDPAFPLILSDVFLLPRHTIKLVFHDAQGKIRQAGGSPAILHCQLLPEVIPLNASGLNQAMAQAAGLLLETVLASFGTHIADAHGGNGGVLLDAAGEPLRFTTPRPDGTLHTQYIPVVLDYGYYSEIGPKRLAAILAQHQVTPAQVAGIIAALPQAADLRALLDDAAQPLEARYAAVIAAAGCPRQAFGRLLYQVTPPAILPQLWLDQSEAQWRTTKEKNYPPLHDQARLNVLYPVYDEILFPQRIEEYHLTLT